MKIEARNHPAQAKHPFSDAPLFYDNECTKPVPLITDQKALFLDGKQVGYCGIEPGRPLSFTTRLPEAVIAEITRFVTDHFGAPKSVAQPPRPDLVAAVEREFDLTLEDDGDDSFDQDE